VGFPIRTSADRCLVDGSPQLFAVTHVLHRFLAPRHSPLALCSLERTRCSCLLCSSQGALGGRIAEPVRARRERRREAVLRLLQNGREDRPAGRSNEGGKPATSRDSTTNPPVHQLGVQAPGGLRPPTVWNGLLRKEVIQPHLPVRLPCYDFTPITDPTFDGSLPEGWATGFGCCRLSWCDGRCVQGPGTYSPRRADPGLLATPASWSRVADSNPN
jgi:hypothetical protein